MPEEYTDLRRKTQNFRVTRGDSWSFEGRLKDADDNPIDLTGATILAQLRITPDATDKVDMNAEITDAVNGKFVVGQDSALSAGVYDVQITTAGGVTRTYVGGKISLEKDVTRP